MRKVRTSLSSSLWVKYCHSCSSTRMALALNNPQRFDIPLKQRNPTCREKLLKVIFNWYRWQERIKELCYQHNFMIYTCVCTLSTSIISVKMIVLFILAYWLSVRVFASGPGDRGSVSGWVIRKTQKAVLDTSMLNTQHFNGKVEQSRERSSALPYTSVL